MGILALSIEFKMMKMYSFNKICILIHKSVLEKLTLTSQKQFAIFSHERLWLAI